MEKKVCDFDCFNCKYDDCVSDSSYNPIKVEPTSQREVKNARRRELYRANREKNIETSKKYYKEHKEEILKKKREKYHANNSK
jgi:hypothetical protein